eukprot:4179064-Pyramimonas_sp.AAC.1
MGHHGLFLVRFYRGLGGSQLKHPCAGHLSDYGSRMLKKVAKGQPPGRSQWARQNQVVKTRRRK